MSRNLLPSPELDDLFGPDGTLARRHPGYEFREEQLLLAKEVAGALEDGSTLVAEAGTGVGKSMAYLLPAALWAAANEKRVLVSTHTKALQEQLIHKDLPDIAAALSEHGIALRFSHLMGADNYLCLQRLDTACKREPEPVLDRLSEWARTATTASRSSIPFPVPPTVWSAVCRDTDLCLGDRGPFRDRCLFKKERQRAMSAHIVVVNHSLFLSGGWLPPHHAVVFDEAHNLEGAAKDLMTRQVSTSRWDRLLNDIYNPESRKGFARRMLAEDRALEAEASRVLKLAKEEGRAFFRKIAADHELAARDPHVQARRLREGYKIENTLDPILKSLLEMFKTWGKALENDEEEAELASLVRRATECNVDLNAFLHGEQNGHAHWVEREKEWIGLQIAPLDLAESLGHEWEQLKERKVGLVFTSATLATGGSLRHFLETHGIANANDLKLGSPFDYKNNACLFLDPSIPSPQAQPAAYREAVARRLLEIVPVVKGGVFVLFTSFQTMDAVLKRVREKLAKDRPVFVQGEAPPAELLKGFRAAGDGVLFGVDTFWQGVDVQGESLACVVITKLPFGNFTTPIEEARREWFVTQGRDYFSEHSLPRAVLKFRQGFGRLIRSKTDRGAVVVLDSRITTGFYKQAFIDALPACRHAESVSDLAEFFAAGA